MKFTINSSNKERTIKGKEITITSKGIIIKNTTQMSVKDSWEYEIFIDQKVLNEEDCFELIGDNK